MTDLNCPIMYLAGRKEVNGELGCRDRSLLRRMSSEEAIDNERLASRCPDALTTLNQDFRRAENL